MANDTNTTTTKAPQLVAWHITEKGEKRYWKKIGAAWAHKDSKGFTLQLDFFPTGGRITLRAPNEKPEGNGGSQ